MRDRQQQRWPALHDLVLLLKVLQWQKLTEMFYQFPLFPRSLAEDRSTGAKEASSMGFSSGFEARVTKQRPI